MTIRKATILGAGNMGSQIASLLVNAGLQVKMLDIVIDDNEPNKLSKVAYDRIADKRKGQLFSDKFVGNLSYGNFETDLKDESDSDLFIEAVSEELEIKHDLWTKVGKVAKEDAILTSNTSGIPIHEVASVLKPEQQERFLGFHFFNPPRHMKLIEIIPHSGTNEDVVSELRDFTINTLGKGVVVANDVNGFVGNRVGVYSMMDIINRAEKEGISISEVDAITGPVIGRPKTATYRLADLVGVDIAYHVATGMREDPAEEEYFVVPKSIEKLMELGNLGNKSKQGFYKREGKKEFLTFNPDTEDYSAAKEVNLPILDELGRNLSKNFQTIFNAEDKTGKFLWTTLSNLLYYSAINVPKATDDYKNIDRALIWGFGWKVGPFQIWDMIGFEEVKNKLREEHGELPEWVEKRTNKFYDENESLVQVKSLNDYVSESIWEKEKISDLQATSDNILIYTMRTPSNTITAEFSDDLQKAVNYLETSDYRAMVIHSEGKNFCVGANLADIATEIREGRAKESVSQMVDSLHQAVSAVKYSNKPIVTAAKGQALGGGAELLLHSPYVVAATETYIGLVEAGVGLVPSGGGLSELAERIYVQNLERADEIRLLKKAFMGVATAKVSRNAYDAIAMGYLRDTDMIVANEDLVLEAAIKKADLEASYNYIPQAPKRFSVEGTNFYAIALAQLDAMIVGNFASEYDAEIGKHIASILSGGRVPLNTLANKEYIMSLEKEAFIELCNNQKTLDRMEHMLKTKKPLRN